MGLLELSKENVRALWQLFIDSGNRMVDNEKFGIIMVTHKQINKKIETVLQMRAMRKKDIGGHHQEEMLKSNLVYDEPLELLLMEFKDGKVDDEVFKQRMANHGEINKTIRLLTKAVPQEDWTQVESLLQEIESLLRDEITEDSKPCVPESEDKIGQ